MSARWARVAAPAALVVLATLVWGGFGQRLDVPTVFGDELIYWEAARSLASGDGLAVREGAYGFGPLYPALLAPLHALEPGAYAAYSWAKWLNAFAFGLAAIPVYLLARRLLDGRWALVCAALALLVPSALYTGFVMTESVAYAAACLAFLAMHRVLERPTTAAQLGALGAIGLATSVRLQLAALGVALVLALALRWVMAHGWSLPGLAALRRAWPVATAVVLAVVAVVGSLLLGGDPPGGYDDLWGGYAPGEVLRWSWYALAGLGLYLAFVPLVVAPAALTALVRSREPSRQALAALVPSVAVVLLLVVGAFSATSFGVGFLHDRYLFTIAPLAILLVACWATTPGRGSPALLGTGAVLAVLLAVTLPSYLVGKDGGRQFDAIATTAVAHVTERLARPDAARALLIALALVAVAALVLPLSLRWLALVPIALLFAANGLLAWDVRTESAQNVTFASLDDAEVAWLDRALPAGATAAALFDGAEVDVRDAFRLTEFFNAAVGPVYDTGQGYAPTIGSVVVAIDGSGRVSAAGEPVVAGHVVVEPGGGVRGERVADGTVERLTLWRATSPLTLVEAP